MGEHCILLAKCEHTTSQSFCQDGNTLEMPQPRGIADPPFCSGLSIRTASLLATATET